MALKGRGLILQLPRQNSPVGLPYLLHMQSAIFPEWNKRDNETQPKSLNDRSTSGAGSFVMRDKRRAERETFLFGGCHIPKYFIQTAFVNIFGF
jgi:hypothetical protein